MIAHKAKLYQAHVRRGSTLYVTNLPGTSREGIAISGRTAFGASNATTGATMIGLGYEPLLSGN